MIGPQMPTGEIENWQVRRGLFATLTILVAAAVLVPPIVYQVRHFNLPFNDVGTYVRPIWNFLEYGRFVVYSDGTSDFFADQHFEPLIILFVPFVRLFGTMGYITLITGALAASTGYVYLLTAAVCKSRWTGGLAAAAYIANPYTTAIAMSFHIEPFGLLFLLAFAYYAYAGNQRLAWIALALALIVKEDMGVYAVIIAVFVARPGRVRNSALFAAAAVAYYVVVIVLFWHWLYPTGYYTTSFYSVNGHPMTKTEIVLGLLGRWREYVPLLFTGAGGAFQLTLLFVGVLAGWRYVLVCGLMLIWLTYPEGPPRSTFSYYYSYPAMLLSYVILPFALRTLHSGATRLATRWRLGGRRAGAGAVALLMTITVVSNVARHFAGRAPAAIEREVDPRWVYAHRSGVDAPIVRVLIDKYLRGNSESVLAQYYTVMAIPQRAKMYITYKDADHVLQGKISPAFVLLDLGADDPIAAPGTAQQLASMLRRGERYVPVWDDQNVLLYRRVNVQVAP